MTGKEGVVNSTCLEEVVKGVSDPLILTPTHIAKNELLKKLGDLAKDLRIMTTTAFLKEMKTTKLADAQEKLMYFEGENNIKAVKAMKDKINDLIKSGRANEPIFENKEDIENPDIVILDEAGMIMRQDIEELKLRARVILGVGDSFQLPPVVTRGDEYYEDWYYNRKHDWELTTVHRNTGDVLNFVNRIRDYKDSAKFDLYREIKKSNMTDVMILKRSDKLFKKMGEEDMMLLAFYNNEVDRLAYKVRQAMGYDYKIIEKGEPLYAANNKTGMGQVRINNKDKVFLNANFDLTQLKGIVSLTKNQTNETTTVEINSARLNSALTESQKKVKLSNLNALILRHDRARTVYGAQGAQSEKVIWGGTIPNNFSTLKHNRMLYTAGSRAQERFGVLEPV